MAGFNHNVQSLANAIVDCIPSSRPPTDRLQKVKLIAHRGAWNTSSRQENTLSAFEACLNKNIWGLEFDIRWTRDDHPIIHHDATTHRIFGEDKSIAAMTLAELRSGFPLIPTLEEMVERFGHKKHFMMELKTKLSLKQCEILQKTMSPLRAIDDYHIMALQFKILDSVSFIDRKALVSIAQWNTHSVYKQTLQQNLGALTGQYLLLTQSMRKGCARQGIQVGAGFLDGENLFYREVNRGIDWVFTNKALELSALL